MTNKEKAREILETWSKDTLIDAMLNEMNPNEIADFIKNNE